MVPLKHYCWQLINALCKIFSESNFNCNLSWFFRYLSPLIWPYCLFKEENQKQHHQVCMSTQFFSLCGCMALACKIFVWALVKTSVNGLMESGIQSAVFEIIYSTWIIACIINIEQVTLNIHQYTLPEVTICVFYKWILQISSKTILSGQRGCWNRPWTRMFSEVWDLCLKRFRLSWMQQPHISLLFHSFTNFLKKRQINSCKCKCSWSFDHDKLVCKCKRIILKLNAKQIFLRDETGTGLCQHLASPMGFLRDKSEDMECMRNKFTYSTFRMAGSKKAAGRGLSHNLSFSSSLNYPSVFTEQLISFFR